MTIELLRPRDGRVRLRPEATASAAPAMVGTGPVVVPRSETYYFTIEFPRPCEAPDIDKDVSLDDLRAISKRHAVTEVSIAPEPGWPEGWR